jgi:hypothetical protein
MSESCESCLFWLFEHNGPDGEYKVGQCRRRAPVIVEYGPTFPTMLGRQWCGEYQRKTAESSTATDY